MTLTRLLKMQREKIFQDHRIYTCAVLSHYNFQMWPNIDNPNDAQVAWVILLSTAPQSGLASCLP